MATIAGNFINASPIGDLSIFFLALNAELELLRNGTGESRRLPLHDLFRGYKELDRSEDEIVTALRFRVPAANDLFHFEKVSKRMHLDIASVNSAILLRMEGNRIREGRISAGGVAPIPLLLRKTSASLEGATLSDALVEKIVRLALEEISPISDVRGSKEYKSLLLAQLLRAHFYGFLDTLNAGP
jgi:xanthine dehydrogenase small subunit